jgi:alkyl sulfatase BDS1-like metallo-beta-lactamase superfamily hydrolase
MNEGKDLFTLMREIHLPEDLDVGEGRGRTHWLVRAVWEGHTGWFQFDSTADLYWVPPRAVAGDLVELAGGPGALAQRAAEHLDDRRPLEALRLLELALDVDPNHRQALEVNRRALLQLIDRSGGRSYDELRWLETQLESVDAVLEAR